MLFHERLWGVCCYDDETKMSYSSFFLHLFKLIKDLHFFFSKHEFEICICFMKFLEILLSSISISQVQEVPFNGIKGSFPVSGEPVKKGEGD